jgi:hypothetical protein
MSWQDVFSSRLYWAFPIFLAAALLLGSSVAVAAQVGEFNLLNNSKITEEVMSLSFFALSLRSVVI